MNSSSKKTSRSFTISPDMPLDLLLEIAELAQKNIELKKAKAAEALRKKWQSEAEKLEMTPREVLGIKEETKSNHRIKRYSPKNKPSLVYTKGPHPDWLKMLLDGFNKKTVNELVEIGEVVVQE